MGIFKHGRMWWFEYRRRSPALRVVKSTGISVVDAEGQKKAQAVFDAFKMGVEVRPKKSAIEAVLEAIYGGGAERQGIQVSSLWAIYEDWFKGKHKKVSESTWRNSKNECARVVDWLLKQKCDDISDVSVIVARRYVNHLSQAKANKTVRNIVRMIGHIWNTIAQMHPGVHNPWPAACPDDDGTTVRRLNFTRTQIPAILDAAKELGNNWYLASMIALYTGLRYGDIATLEWEKIDLKARTITTTPRKTKGSSGVEVTIPIADKLYELLKGGGEGFVLPEHAIVYEARSRLPVTFAQVLERAGVAGAYTFHSWRHTANTMMAEAGVSSEIRQMICGWTNGAMARHYDHSQRLGELAAAIAKIGG